MFIVVVQLKDNRVRFVCGQSVTARIEHATRYETEDKAVQQMEKSIKWAGVKDCWTKSV